MFQTTILDNLMTIRELVLKEKLILYYNFLLIKLKINKFIVIKQSNF